MKQNHMTRPGDGVLVGLSGGADSVGLLLVLWKLRETFQISLRALHVHHGLRGAEAACTQAWPGTRIQRCLVHVQRNTRTGLTSRPRLQAGRELKRLSDRLTSVETAGQAVRWGEALNVYFVKSVFRV